MSSFKKQSEFQIPAFIFDKFWRSEYATKKYVERIIGDTVNFGGKKVLDFGCGTGSYSLLFDSDKYVGVDTDRGRIEYATKHYTEYTFRHIENDSLVNLGDNFDYIFIVSTLHHLSNKQIELLTKQFHKILKPNGCIIGMEPCFFPGSTFNNWFMKWIDRGEFIRSEKNYKSLFESLFNFITQKRFKRHSVYNEIFYIASKIDNT